MKMSADEKGQLLIALDEEKRLLFAAVKGQNEISSYCLNTKRFVERISVDFNVNFIKVRNGELSVYSERGFKLNLSQEPLAVKGQPEDLRPEKVEGELVDDSVFRNGADLILTAGEKEKRKKFGYLNETGGIFCRNQSHFCSLIKASNTLICMELTSRRKLLQSFPRNRPIVKLASDPRRRNRVLAADSSGRIHVCELDFETNKIIARLCHWHSDRVGFIGWSPDGEHFFSGGVESVLVKWNAGDLTKEAFAPRLNDVIVDGGIVTEEFVVVLQKDFTVDFFNHQLNLQAR